MNKPHENSPFTPSNSGSDDSDVGDWPWLSDAQRQLAVVIRRAVAVSTAWAMVAQDDASGARRQRFKEGEDDDKEEEQDNG